MGVTKQNHPGESSDVETRSVVLHIGDVQVYAVEDNVATLLDQGPLELSVGLDDDKERVLTAVVDQQTAWDLTPDLPVLRNARNTYTFAVAGGGLFYSLLLAHGTPESEVALLEDILAERTAYETHKPSTALDKAQTEAAVHHVAKVLEAEHPGGAATAVDPAHPVAHDQPPEGHTERIARGAAQLSGAITAGALWATGKMEENSERLRAKLKPVTSPVPVPGLVKSGVKNMRKTAWRSAGFVGIASSKTADIALRIGDSIVKRLGRNVFGSYLSSGGHKRTQAAREIAAASIVAASQVYDSMEEAALLVLNSAKDTSTSVIAHKYGPDVGALARDATSLGVASAVGASRIKGFGVQTMATKIARRTAKGLIASAVVAAKEQQVQGAALKGVTIPSETAKTIGPAQQSPFASSAQREADLAAQKGVDSIRR